MSSLQEQLLKAGLVDDKKLARAEQEKNRRRQERRAARPGQATGSKQKSAARSRA
jgi:uncharacterized protein YaiL (DUF2058 family)